MQRFTILFLALVLGIVCPLPADTYDTHTLVRIDVPKGVQRDWIVASRIDVVNAGPWWVKALVRPDELKKLRELGFAVEVLEAEMARDRALWREADEAARVLAPNFYYTASKFNTVNPGASTLMKHLLDLHNAHPDITRLYDIGNSYSGIYDIIAIQVTKNPDVVEAEPKIRIYGNIHGDEKGGLMVACEALDWILANYPADPNARKLVDESELWFIPMGNPDGNASNNRENANHVDLNRNFWGPNGSGGGSGPFSEPETQAIRDLTEVMGKRFATGLSFHGGEICFNSIWNYTSDAPSDEPIFWSDRTGGEYSGCSNLNGCLTIAPDGLAEAYQEGCTTPGFWFTEGADWYPTTGDTNDWSYGVWSALDTTLEVTLSKTPSTSQIPVFCAEHLPAVINYMLKTFQGASGVMTDSATGSPLDGTVSATCTASSSISVPHDYQAIYTDPVAGDFHRVLQPGTYTITCSAPGYTDLVVPGIVVMADTTTTVNCSMSTPCANNPTTVNVTPTGPLTECPGTALTLTCGVTGGTGSIIQWYDGVDPIPGAISPTCSPNTTGTHAYTCKATGSGCASGIMDATPTQITWQAEPAFAGLTSVTNPQEATCRLDLAWSAGSTPCAGGVTYNIYRSTTPGFTPAISNRIATGLSGTTFQDSNGLASGTMYYYKVRAVTVANGTEETNVVERSGAPTGVGGGPFTALALENFESAWGTYGDNPPSGWTIVDNGSQSPKVWDTNDWYRFSKGGSYGFIARVNYSPIENQDDSIITPSFDLPAGASSASLEYDHYFYVYSTPDEYGYVDFMSDQTPSWTNLITYTATTGTSSLYNHASVNLLPYAGQTNCKVRFRYVAQDDWYWELDNVKVSGIVDTACTTASAAPPLVKDSGTTAVKFTKGSGNTLNVTYDAVSCNADKIVVLHNTIGTWTGYAGCAQNNGGNGGSTTIDSTGQTSTWYNLVWTGGTTAGHPGFATGGARTWNVGTLCGMTGDDQSHSTCP